VKIGASVTRAFLVRPLWLVLLLSLSVSALSNPVTAQTPQSLPDSRLVIETKDGKVPFTVEVATTPKQREIGLMYRHSLAADRGMLFVYERSGPVAIWMRNTFIPLDILFLDDEGGIIHIQQRAVPQSLQTISAGASTRAVLELRGGSAARHGITRGDRVIHEAIGTKPE